MLYDLEAMIDKVGRVHPACSPPNDGDAVENDVGAAISRGRLSTLTVEMEMVAGLLDKLTSSSLETIYATQVKSKLDPCLVQIVRDLSDPTCEDTVTLLRIIAVVEKSIMPQLQMLSEENLIQVVMMISRTTAAQLGSFLATLPAHPRERIEALEMDLRKLVGFLAGLTELQAREAFTPIMQLLSDLSEGRAVAQSPRLEPRGEALNENQVKSILLQSRDIL